MRLIPVFEVLYFFYALISIISLLRLYFIYNIYTIINTIYFTFFSLVCHQVHLGVQAVFGPTDPYIGNHIQSVFDALDIPHLESRLDFDGRLKEFSINLYPSQPMLNQAYLDFIKFLNWTRIAIIYEENHGELLISPFLFNFDKTKGI